MTSPKDEKKNLFQQKIKISSVKKILNDITSIPENPNEIFTLLYQIGNSETSTVYKAVHNITKKIYAIKIIDFSKNNKNCFNYKLIEEETNLMKSLNKSKNIVNFYGSYYSQTGDSLWLILEYCFAGSAIDLMLSMNRTFSEVEISNIIGNILKGLLFIHENNLIHNNIKASNILLTEDGLAKLDFTNNIKNIINQNSFQNCNKSDDIFNIGIACIELCNGVPPNIIGNNVNIDELIDKNEHSEDFYEFIKVCLNKNNDLNDLINSKFIKNQYSEKILSVLIEKHEKDIQIYRENKHKENYCINNFAEYSFRNKEITKTTNSNCERDESPNKESNYTSHFNVENKLKTEPSEENKENNLHINQEILPSSASLSKYTTNNILKESSENQIQYNIVTTNMNSNFENSSPESFLNFSDEKQQNFTTFHRIDIGEEENNKNNKNKNISSELHQENSTSSFNLIKNKINAKKIINILQYKPKIILNNNFNKNYNKKKQETEKQNLSSDDINFNIMQINLKFDISQRKNNKNKILYKKPHIKKKIFKKKEENPENANIDEEEDSQFIFPVKQRHISVLPNFFNNNDEEGKINRTNYFDIKSNYALFTKDDKFFARTSNSFYKNEKNAITEEISEEDDETNNNYNYKAKMFSNDLSKFRFMKKYRMNLDKDISINKMHSKYFGK